MLPWAAGLILFAGCVVEQPAPPPQPPPVADADAPPPPRVEVVPPQPEVAFIWTPGYWDWRDRWYWVHGYWGPRPHPGAVWVRGGWGYRGHHRVWTHPHWQ